MRCGRARRRKTTHGAAVLRLALSLPKRRDTEKRNSLKHQALSWAGCEVACTFGVNILSRPWRPLLPHSFGRVSTAIGISESRFEVASAIASLRRSLEVKTRTAALPSFDISR